MILNKDIHEFDDLEEKEEKKLHSVWEWIKRIPYVLDAMLFEKTYKDEYERALKEILSLKKQLKSANHRKEISNKYSRQLARKIREMKKGDRNDEKEN